MEATYLSEYACKITIDHLKFSVNAAMDDGDFILITDYKYVNISTSNSVPIFIEDGCYEHGKIMMEEMDITVDGDFRRIRYYEQFRFDELVIKAIPSQLHFASSGYAIEYGSYKFVIISPGVPHFTLEMPFIQELDALILLNVAEASNQFSTKLKNMQLCIQDAVNNKTPVLITCNPDDGYLFNLLFVLQKVQYFTPTTLHLLFKSGLKSYTLINSIPESLNHELKNKAFLGKYGCDLHFNLFPNCYDKQFQSNWLSDAGIILTCNNFSTPDLLNSFDRICFMKNLQGLYLDINARNSPHLPNVVCKYDGFCQLDARMTISEVLQHFKAREILTFKSSTFANEGALKTIYSNLSLKSINEPHTFEIKELTMQRLFKSKQISDANFTTFHAANATYQFTYFNGNLQNDMINIYPVKSDLLMGNLDLGLLTKACKVVFYDYSQIEVSEENEGLVQIFVSDVLVVSIKGGQIVIESEELEMIKKLQNYLYQSNLINQT